MSKAEKRSRRKLPPMEAGQRYGRLVAVCFVQRNQHGHHMWRFICDCGTQHIATTNNVRRGVAKSCGCLKSERDAVRFRTHGKSGTPEYTAWALMHQRCRHPHSKNAERYLKRGIAVCERWNSFESFLTDMGTKPTPTHSLERSDNNGNYEPGNCVWATPAQQSRNQERTRFVIFRGEKMCIIDAAKAAGIGLSSIYRRLKKGWSVERALHEPRREPRPTLRRPKL